MRLPGPAAFICFALLAPWTRAYIPAQGTNDTSLVPDPSDTDSTVLLRWTDEGTYQEGVNRQITKDGGSPGIEKGALVHFWENKTYFSPRGATQYSTTPWIALVDCDRNATDASQEEDIFTQARDLGAVAALLYSTYSETCLINPDYLDPAEFQKVLDIYTTVTKSSARLIESQFSNVNKTIYYFFNGTRLNDSATEVENAISGEGVQPGFLIATLKWDNVTDPDPGDGFGGPSAEPPTTGSGGGSNTDTGLAMIILYVVTGCVSLLFGIVIISGAIRALRHPERYGPRRGDPTMDGPEGEPQTRAGGLTRAILDTFPVVKFGRGNIAAHQERMRQMAYNKPVEGAEWPASHTDTSPSPKQHSEAFEMATQGEEDSNAPRLGFMPSPLMPSRPSSESYKEGDPIPRPRPQGPPGLEATADEPTPEMIGTETCPICILDFEDGDDLRVLPCEGQHKFHKDCVDPWLLELSSSCPLCRQDFYALENMANGVSPEEVGYPSVRDESSEPGAVPHTRPRGGFSKYLLTARRRRQDAGRGSGEESSTGHASAT